MRLDHNQFGNFRHATEHDGSRSGPCEWRWAPSIDKKGKLSRYERPIPHHLGATGPYPLTRPIFLCLPDGHGNHSMFTLIIRIRLAAI